MHRREVIKYIGGIAAVSTTGCLDRISGNGETENKTLDNTEFNVVNKGGGEDTDNASVEFNKDSNTVKVTGLISGNNGCYTAELESSNYDDQNDVLNLNIRSFEDSEEGEMCTQVIIEINYESTAEFSNGLPGIVRVNHNGEMVKEASKE